jgi:mannose-6-phosphate isomerase-like protein (cupin superfamily)
MPIWAGRQGVRALGSFYDDWLGLWDKAEAERKAERRNIHEEEFAWVETQQDYRAALMVSPETGFRTWGSTSMIAEIPAHSHSGAHKHGEEAIFILSGTGFSVVDGIRYDWKQHSVLAIPFGAVHQHFNTGDIPARYISVLAVHLEHFVGLHRTMQLEPWGKTVREPDAEASPDGMAPDGGYRVVLHKENAIVKKAEGDGVPVLPADMPEFDPEHPLVVGDVDGMHALPDGFHKAQVLNYMRINKDINDFKLHTVEVSGLLTDGPHEYGGMHAHMEAHLFIIEGHGYSLVNGEKVPWKPGTCFHVPGPQTPHRHVNESDGNATMVRMAFGIRYFFERAAKREFPYLYLSPRQAVLERNVAGRR